METLGGKREKKVTPAAASPTAASDEKQAEENKKVVGWQYRYRVSKMREAQKQEAAEALAKGASKKRDHVPIDERLDPELARLPPEARIVGWQYRFVRLFSDFPKIGFLFHCLDIAFDVNLMH